MAFINQTNYQYYTPGQRFTATADQTEFLLTLDPLPISKANFIVLVNDQEVDDNIYNYSASGGDAGKVIFTFGNQRAAGDLVEIKLTNPIIAGNYRYISLSDIVNNFMVSYVGKDKIIPRIKRTDVLFHAKRGIQEFSYDITKVEKIQEVEVGSNLSVLMPQDYVDYVQISRIDNAGIERPLYPMRFTSIPTESILQNADHEYLFDDDDSLLKQTPATQTRFKDADTGNFTGLFDNDVNNDLERAHERISEYGGRFGAFPEFAQKNGNFIIDELNGKFHFTSDLANTVITIKYVSDGMGTDAEMRVHKFAEEAIYKHIVYAVVSARTGFPEYIVQRYKRDRFASIRNAKLRLANLNPRELAQVMRNKSKVIKH